MYEDNLSKLINHTSRVSTNMYEIKCLYRKFCNTTTNYVLELNKTMVHPHLEYVT